MSRKNFIEEVVSGDGLRRNGIKKIRDAPKAC